MQQCLHGFLYRPCNNSNERFNQIIIIGNEEFVSILFIPFLHLQLSFTDFLIISGALEFNAEAVVIFMIVHDHNIWLSFHITFFPLMDSLFRGLLVFAEPGSNDGFRIKSSYIIYSTTLQWRSASFSIFNIWLFGLSNILYCPYFLIDGRTFDKTGNHETF